jgi:quercetin dioxygenase-like cupin family protein
MPAEDAAAVAPHLYGVVMENERVRVLKVRGKPGDKSELHSHPSMVAIALANSDLRFSSADGQSREEKLKTGQVVHSDAVEHATEIMGSTEAHFLLIELK